MVSHSTTPYETTLMFRQIFLLFVSLISIESEVVTPGILATIVVPPTVPTLGEILKNFGVI